MLTPRAQVCRRGRWCGRQDMSPHQLHHQQVPFRICPDRVRQLRRHCYVRLPFTLLYNTHLISHGHVCGRCACVGMDELLTC